MTSCVTSGQLVPGARENVLLNGWRQWLLTLTGWLWGDSWATPKPCCVFYCLQSAWWAPKRLAGIHLLLGRSVKSFDGGLVHSVGGFPVEEHQNSMLLLWYPECRPVLFLLFHAVTGAAYRQYLLQNATKARNNRQMHYHKLALTLLDLAVKFQSLINSTASTMYWRMQSRARVRDWKKQNVTSVDRVTKVMRRKGIGGNSYPKGQIVGSFVWFTAKTDPASCIDGHELKTEKEYWIWRKYNCRTAAVTWQIRRFYADCRNIMHLSAAIPGEIKKWR